MERKPTRWINSFFASLLSHYGYQPLSILEASIKTYVISITNNTPFYMVIRSLNIEKEFLTKFCEV
ncbi:hypothetical protein VCHA54P500_200029 [Vibrio chagasii]|nr:hypothetical protein VCHA34P117_210029 [Vibrio chagasii]CAH7045860.1 hypothetical protein VCHA48P439_200029 [Vibrio chagasii]CAH7056706.1 hypothetical protein VCHA40O236_200029 [Vibrio chagasii]CAH7111374.1 hypothetical protein VCHA54P500_200029 [Vibrio chagasii]CAH7219935.1 hypothetical protein VCHA38P215_30087 [Vibrio chagasii]